MSVRLLIGDARHRLKELPDGSIHTCVTSPPYFGLRDYGVDGQIGLEETPDAFVAQMVEVFREVRRVLRDDGTLWLNLGDTYAGGGNGGGGNYAADRANWRVVPTRSGQRQAVRGLKPKDLIGIPWRVAFALQADGWYLRQDIIWAKPNPMPESVKDRCTKSHEYLFLLTKSASYHYDAAAIAEEAIYAGLSGQDKTGFKNASDFDGKHRANPEVRRESRKNSFARAAKDAGGVSGDKPQFRADREPIAYEGKRNKRSVWNVPTQPFSGAHFATFPPALVEPCVLAGCPVSGTVLDPFGGAGTTGLVADRLQRNAVLIELNPAYAEIARQRLEEDGGMFSSVEVAA